MNLKLILLIAFLLAGCASNEAKVINQRNKDKCYSVSDCAKAIQMAVIHHWSKPRNLANDPDVLLKLSLLPSGAVESVTIDRSSGNKEFDESAIQAVKNAAPFSEISDLSSEIFNKKFKTIKLNFKPEEFFK